MTSYHFEINAQWGSSNPQVDLPANTDTNMLDNFVGAGALVSMPQGIMLRSVLFNLSAELNPLPSGITISVGVTGNNQLFIPSSLGITTDMINAGAILIPITGVQVA